MAETGSRKLLLYMRKRNKIVVVGYVYESRQNGIVLDAGGGVSPTLSVGQHFGCEPKIRVVYEV